jgi:hypothetical protein
LFPKLSDSGMFLRPQDNFKRKLLRPEEEFQKETRL